MDVVSDGRNATASGTAKKDSPSASEPGGSDKESDNDEKVCMCHACFLVLSTHLMKCDLCIWIVQYNSTF